MFGLEGKRVVITGASGGVGMALVGRFAELGAVVVACDVPGTDFGALPVDRYHLFDITDRDAVETAARAICEDGAPDVMVSNAGWTRAETMAQLTTERFDHEMDLNFRGAADLSRALLPAMRANPSGASFVFVSSVNALAHYGNPAYAAAKAGLGAWARALAAEEGVNGIRANVVAPGSIRTAAWDHRIERDPAILERVSSFFPIGRMVAPGEVANAVAFVASPLASGITGVTIPVDGGLSSSHLPFVREIA
ncbi:MULTISPECIES: SDR family oxidoreductase [unclassified Roseitalea]|uniref:SDR family NAD(P)-dependent oxidoreductase n=1 Tax=unclassified Roseitalea TaxID=2639107 RepID=UPI00273D937D|nr:MULTISPECIES: SDR family oxidoreductase [unclassified Roseitalea]